MCPWSLASASSILVLGLQRVCPWKGCPCPRIFLCPWPWPETLRPRLHLWLLRRGWSNGWVKKKGTNAPLILPSVLFLQKRFVVGLASYIILLSKSMIVTLPPTALAMITLLNGLWNAVFSYKHLSYCYGLQNRNKLMKTKFPRKTVFCADEFQMKTIRVNLFLVGGWSV